MDLPLTDTIAPDVTMETPILIPSAPNKTAGELVTITSYSPPGVFNILCANSRGASFLLTLQSKLRSSKANAMKIACGI